MLLPMSKLQISSSIALGVYILESSAKQAFKTMAFEYVTNLASLQGRVQANSQTTT